MLPLSINIRYIAGVAAATLLGIGTGSANAAQATFQTFVIKSPTAQTLPTKVKHTSSEDRVYVAHKRYDPSSRFRSQFTATVFPGSSGISMTSFGSMNGSNITSKVDSVQTSQGNMVDTGSFDIEHSGNGVSFGSNILNTLGSYPGVRFYTSNPKSSVTTGYGIYNIQTLKGHTQLLPMTDMRCKLGKSSVVSSGIAADGSMLSSYEFNGQQFGLSMTDSGGPAIGGQVMSLTAHQNIGSKSIIYARGSEGSNGGNHLTSFGGVSKARSAVVSFDNYNYMDRTVAYVQRDVSVLMPHKDNMLTAELRQDDSQSHIGNMEHGWSTNDLSMAYFSRLKSGQSIWQGLELVEGSKGSGLTHSILSLGFNSAFGRRWKMQTALQGSSRTHGLAIKGWLDYSVNSDWAVRLLYGPTFRQFDPYATQTAVGFQIVRNLNTASRPSGTIAGHIYLDGSPCVVPMTVTLDDGNECEVNRNGSYRLNHLTDGEYTVSVDNDTLPADLSADNWRYSVTVKSRHPSKCDFFLHKVGSIKGTVDIVAGPLDDVDPMARVAVVIRDTEGHSTSTDVDGSFLLGDLPNGPCTLSIDPKSIPADYVVNPPDSVSTVIVVGQPAAPIHFSISPKCKAVDFSSVGK